MTPQENVKPNADNDLKFRAGIKPDQPADPDPKKVTPMKESGNDDGDLQYFTE